MNRLIVLLKIFIFICLFSVNSFAQLDGVAIKDSVVIATFKHFFVPNKIVSGDDKPFGPDTVTYNFNWEVDNQPVDLPVSLNIRGNDTTIYFPYEFTESGTYSIDLEVIDNSAGLTYYASETIYVDELIEVPNVFTPDDDGINDVFVVKSSGMEDQILKLQIYSRNGNLVHERIGNVVYWDGRLASGQKAGEGVYYYFITTQSEPKIVRKGFFHLYR